MNPESNRVEFACPSCGVVLDVLASKAGYVIECPECAAAMEVPIPEPDTGAASAPKRKIIKRGGPSTLQQRAPAPLPVRKPNKSRVGLIFALFLLLGGLAGGGAWLWTRGFFGGEPSPGGTSGSRRAAQTVAPNAPLASQAAPARTDRWSLDQPARVTAFQWGGDGEDQILDMVARQNGNLVITGVIPSPANIPSAARQRHTLLDARPGTDHAFLAELSADGRDILWFSTFGGDLLRPTCLALRPDGSIALGGEARGRASGHPDIEGDFRGRNSILGVVSADGSRVEWMIEGGPNQSEVSGIAVDAQGRVYFTAGGRVRGSQAYVLRREPNGDPSPFPRATLGGKENWAINFDVRTDEFKQEGQVGAFYAKGAQGSGYDYDGPTGPWGPVRFSLAGMREGGQIVVLPQGDFVVTGTLQYDFREGGNRSFPAFDLIVARYTPDGELVWSTNLYQEGDSIHTPDQKARHLVFNPHNGDLYVLAIQHGSNIYRFMGDLRGDTGNLMIGWIGRVDPQTGALKAGWYWQNNRLGNYTNTGFPASPPHPQLAGNNPQRLAVDSEGRVYLSGNAAAKAWTSPHAWKNWPAVQSGGGNPALVVLDPGLQRHVYVSMIRGEDQDRGTARGVVVSEHGVWVGGANGTRNFPTGDVPAWSNPEPVGTRDAFLVNFRFDR